MLNKIQEILKKGYYIMFEEVPCNGADIINIQIDTIDPEYLVIRKQTAYCLCEEEVIIKTIDELVAKHEERRGKLVK